MTKQNPDITLQAITANIAAMSDVLQVAAHRAAESLKAATVGERNLAIGTIVDLGDFLEQASALYGAAMALHRKAQI